MSACLFSGLTTEEIETAIQRSGTASDENALPARPSNSIVPVNHTQINLPTVPQGKFLLKLSRQQYASRQDFLKKLEERQAPLVATPLL